ncbi:MAG TPA: hypothetical protein PKE55_10270 [Kiritimatiellia bacterium]|nr:hypothetical protein [Kiritimatiellia bacterium]
MKKVVSGLAALLVSGSTVLASGGWGVYGAYWDTKDGGDGIGPGLRLSLPVVPEFHVEFRTAYIGNFDRARNDLEVIPLEVSGLFRFDLTDSLVGHAGLGVGYYLMSGGWTWQDAANKASADNDVGLFGLLGLEYAWNQDLGLFIEGKYISLDAKKGRTVGNEIRTLDLDGLGLNIGFMLRW